MAQDKSTPKQSLKELVIKTGNPKALDEMLRKYYRSALVEAGASGYYTPDGNTYLVRCFGDLDWLVFSLRSQGYAQIMEIRDIGGEEHEKQGTS